MLAKLVYNQTGVCTPASILSQVAVGQPVNSSVRAYTEIPRLSDLRGMNEYRG